MKYTIQFLSLSILLFLNACNSPLSEKKVTNLSPIGATIEIFQNLTDKKDNYVIVRLFDEDGYTISNETIKLKVNNEDLVFNVKKELYYTTTTTYYTNNVPVDTMYNFEIILTNGESYFLGSVKPIAESREKDIVCNENGNIDKDFVIYWHNLKEINELSIMKSVKLNTSTQTEHNYDYDSIITKAIEGNGKYTITKANYINSKSTISGLEIKFNASKLGSMNTELLEGSEIKIYGHIDKAVDFEEK